MRRRASRGPRPSAQPLRVGEPRGTQIPAIASRHGALSYGPAAARAARLKAEVQERLAWGAAAAAGDGGAAHVDAGETAGIEPWIAGARDPHHRPVCARGEEPPAPAPAATPVARLARRRKTQVGRAADALRQQTGEPVFGIITSVMGFRPCLTRGLDNVQGEGTLGCLAWNLKRMAVWRLQ